MYDLEQALASLRAAAKRHAINAAYLPRDLMCAAVAFTVQLAIESAIESRPDCKQLRELERQLIASINAVDSLNREDSQGSERTANTAIGTGMDADAPHQLTNDEIINVRDALLARGDIAALPVPDQNLFRDCDIALGAGPKHARRPGSGSCE